ncbi:phosphohexomutase domain-containing protein [Anaerosinus massiliensis]|uniref:phosphomannomutase n=1 Tax=Massilibacillus massiliensis TaxID=1806837 RepID=UPI000AA61DCA|nr:phosphomannomutase [Massilibacillus massiliensis]
MELKRTAFKAYDIRGKYPDEINEELAYRIGRAYVELFNAKKVAVGHDIRLSGQSIQNALELGLTDMGCDVVDIGVCGTEQIYFATAHLNLDGGIMITASHNPKDYNGMKFVREESRPISGDTGLREIEERAVTGTFEPVVGIKAGKVICIDVLEEYVKHLLTYVDKSALKPLKIVVNAGNGAAGAAIDVLEKHLPFEFIKVNHEPDGNFPNGVPNPILQENREATASVIREHKADVGIAWDGDFDRCFMFDEKGDFIEGYYMVGFIAQAFLRSNPGAGIIYDPRLIWNTIELVEEAGGRPIMCKTGHAFIKERMRKEDAVYGGEMSAHHYFKEFSFCDSGMITWLLVVELICRSGKPFSSLMQERMERYPISGEINRTVKDPKAVLEKIEAHYGKDGVVTKVDGLSIEYPNWRFNLRISNTEPVIRLNVEARQDKILLKEKTDELLAMIHA